MGTCALFCFRETLLRGQLDRSLDVSIIQITAAQLIHFCNVFLRRLRLIYSIHYYNLILIPNLISEFKTLSALPGFVLMLNNIIVNDTKAFLDYKLII